MTTEIDDFLAHYGVKGMKWGVRRGPDGVRPIARTLRDSGFGKMAQKNVDRHNQKKYGSSKVTKKDQAKSDKYFSDRDKARTQAKAKRDASSTVAERMGLSKGNTPRDKAGNIKKPSYFREAAFGTWANSKKRYTDPKALKTRTTAGKLAGAAVISSLGGTTMKLIAENSKNPAVSKGLNVVGGILSAGASGVGAASLVTGINAARQERKARAEQE